MVNVGDPKGLSLKFNMEDTTNRYDRLTNRFSDEDYFHKDFTFKYENEKDPEEVRKERREKEKEA